jgi:hypothetical protein
MRTWSTKVRLKLSFSPCCDSGGDSSSIRESLKGCIDDWSFGDEDVAVMESSGLSEECAIGEGVVSFLENLYGFEILNWPDERHGA